MQTDQVPSRARRADAERNRAAILGAARTALATSDTPISMAEIARRAGIGMATLYRNFPSRRELLEALYTDEVNAICAAAKTVNGGISGAVLMAWLRRFSAFSAGKRHIAAELLAHVDSTDPVFGYSRDRVLAAGRPLLVAAQRDREIRDNLTLEQILDMIVAISAINGAPDYLDPILQTVLDALRTQTNGGHI